MADSAAIAIAAHPDDIEFSMAGTLCLLREAGFQTHYLTISSGSCGSMVHRPSALRAIRRREAKAAAAVLGASFHESRTDDFEILYTLPLLRWLTEIIRTVRPSIVLTHSPQDYMEDHVNTSRLAVTAAFARGVPNFAAHGHAPICAEDLAIYHAMPVGLCDNLRRHVMPGAFINVLSVHKKKLAALACHQSQRDWLQATRGMDSLAHDMVKRECAVGRMSRQFRLAEGWRRHSHMGFGQPDADPLKHALREKMLLNRDYERGLAKG